MYLRAVGEADEVDTLGQALHADLLSALGLTIGHHLTQAIVHHIGELSVAAVDVKDAVGGVGIEGERAIVFVEAGEVGGDALGH